jgi:hypothetical protein
MAAIPSCPPLPYFPADYVIQNETADFVDEALALIYHIRSLPDDPWQDHMPDHDDQQKKHLILYNWIALSLVTDEHDVAAIAVYQRQDSVYVYWTKNELTHEDVQHANEFAQLVREAACNRMQLVEFQRLYFELLYKNCFKKLKD